MKKTGLYGLRFMIAFLVFLSAVFGYAESPRGGVTDRVANTHFLNYLICTQAIGGRYQFTSDSKLLETRS